MSAKGGYIVISSTKAEAGHLADQLERSFRGGAWHGPATREVLAGIDDAAAAERPEGYPHSIVDLVRHLTFWLNAARIRIDRGEDVDVAADWRTEEALTAKAWEQVLVDLETAHSKLHDVVLTLDDARLDDAVHGSDPSVRGMLLGMLQHNAYHTGQIVELARRVAV